MKRLYSLLTRLFVRFQPLQTDSVERNFFDYSSRERIKLLRAAGREAQLEQTKLLKEYDAKFGKARIIST
jgi:hypothetical protein